jgi:thiol-disulfide isomerase/thioredoxin
MDRATSLFALAALLAGGCTGKPTDGNPRRAPAQQDAAPVAKARPEFVKASAQGSAIAELVQASQKQAQADGRRLVVYVGATWCEPCQLFHDAVEAGRLDAELAGVRFLEFDADADRGELVDGGYGGRLIPRFAVPGPDGRGDAQRTIEGGTKGDGAVEQIVRRLRPLLEDV